MGNPTWSQHRVWRDLEINNNEVNTGLRLELVAEMNPVKLGLVADMYLVATRTCGVMAVDMWWFYGMTADMWWRYIAPVVTIVRRQCDNL